MAEHPPEPADPATVTAADIAEFTARLARRRSPTLGGDPTDRAELLCDKADLFARIAHQHARTDPALAEQARNIAEQARGIAEQARGIAEHARAAATDPTTHLRHPTQTAHDEPRQHRDHRDQPLRAEIDRGSTSAKGRPPDRAWLVRLRRDNHAVIIAIGLARPSAEHLASKINQLLHPPDTRARHAENTDTHDTTDVKRPSITIASAAGNFAERHCGISASVISTSSPWRRCVNSTSQVVSRRWATQPTPWTGQGHSDPEGL